MPSARLQPPGTFGAEKADCGGDVVAAHLTFGAPTLLAMLDPYGPVMLTFAYVAAFLLWVQPGKFTGIDWPSSRKTRGRLPGPVRPRCEGDYQLKVSGTPLTI